MSKSCNLNIRMDEELYQAIQDTATAETEGDKTKLVTSVLSDVFLPTKEEKKVISVPVMGWVIDHPELGNVIIGGEGYDS